MPQKTLIQSWKDTWNALSRPNKITFVLSITALLLTVGGLIVDVVQNNRQNALDRELFWFQLEAENRSMDHMQTQIDVMNTQTALNAQLEAIARQQAFPLMVMVSPEKSILTIYKIDNSSADFLVVTGFVEAILANNGGARAGLVEIAGVEGVSLGNLISIDVDEFYVGENLASLPLSIESQTPIKLKLFVSIKMKQPLASDNQEGFGNTDYQTQVYVTGLMSSSNSRIDLHFSNTATVSIPLSRILFKVDGFHPQPTDYLPSAETVNLLFYFVGEYFVGFLFAILFSILSYWFFEVRRKK